VGGWSSDGEPDQTRPADARGTPGPPREVIDAAAHRHSRLIGRPRSSRLTTATARTRFRAWRSRPARAPAPPRACSGGDARDGLTTVRDAGGLERGFKLQSSRGCIPGALGALACSHLADRRARRRVSRRATTCDGAYDRCAALRCQRDRSGRDVVRTMVRPAPSDQDRHPRGRQLAPGPRAARRGLIARDDGGAVLADRVARGSGGG